MYNEGIAQGEVEDGRRVFHPDRQVNRAEFTKLVLLGSGVKDADLKPCLKAPFPDVSKDAWFAPYICLAVDLGIISGFPDGTFQPARNVNFANGSKILAKSFGLAFPTSKDAEPWYARYVHALHDSEAVAPSISAFGQPLTRAEMAEMIYRLRNDAPSYRMPSEETDGEPIGMGYTHPFSLEFSIGLTVDPPDPPYVFSSSSTNIFGYSPELEGYKFFHTRPDVRCTASGLWEHCKPVFVDWSIELYVTEKPLTNAKKYFSELPEETLYFGGKRGECYTMGIEGEYISTCFASFGNGRTLVIVREFIDSSLTYLDKEGITPKQLSDTWFDRIRQSMLFIE
jgi:hypothetical protein